jgi:hypothetical protein
MKRRFIEKERKQDQLQARLPRVPRDVKNHISNFLDFDSRFNYGQINKYIYNEAKNDKELQCYKSTNKFTNCTGVIPGLQVGTECLSFCQKHFKSVIATLINIMFSNEIYTRIENDEQDEGDEISDMGLPTMKILRSEIDGTTTVLFEISEEDETFNNWEKYSKLSLGDYITNIFDFTSSYWKEIIFLWDGTVDEVTDIYFQFQDSEFGLDDEIDNDGNIYVKVKNTRFDIKFDMDEPE